MKFGVYPHIRICVLMNMLYIIIRMMCSIYFCSVIKCKSWRFGWNYYGLSDENRPQIAEPKVRMLVCLLRRDSPILDMLAMVQGLFTYRHSGDLLLVRISLNPNGRVAPLLNSVVALWISKSLLFSACVPEDPTAIVNGCSQHRPSVGKHQKVG